MKLITRTERYLLEPQYDTRKSFYGKAEVLRKSNGKEQYTMLFSYSKQVITIDEINIDNPRKYEMLITIHGTYSNTTRRHIREFLRQYNIEDKMIKHMMKHVGEEQKITIEI